MTVVALVVVVIVAVVTAATAYWYLGTLGLQLGKTTSVRRERSLVICKYAFIYFYTVCQP